MKRFCLTSIILATLTAPPAYAQPLSLLTTAEHYIGARHSPDGFRGPWCGSFLGFVAKRSGHAAPRNYRLAIAWAHAGRATHLHAGAVAVMRHHVGIVVGLHNGKVEILSGNHSRRVGIGYYSQRQIIAYREV